jgi:hypothetical protein
VQFRGDRAAGVGRLCPLSRAHGAVPARACRRTSPRTMVASSTCGQAQIRSRVAQIVPKPSRPTQTKPSCTWEALLRRLGDAQATVNVAMAGVQRFPQDWRNQSAAANAFRQAGHPDESERRAAGSTDRRQGRLAAVRLGLHPPCNSAQASLCLHPQAQLAPGQSHATSAHRSNSVRTKLLCLRPLGHLGPDQVALPSPTGPSRSGPSRSAFAHWSNSDGHRRLA